MTSKMDKLFGSKTRVALLAKLVMNPDKSFYLRELSRELKIPYSMLYKEEKNLASLGMVTEEKKGKITLVSMNKNLPYLAELKNLIIKTVGLGDLLRNLFSGFGKIRYALVFGSFASGEESGSSDVDLLIVGSISEEKILSVVSRVEKEVAREINYLLWNEEEFRKRVKHKHHLLREIANKPVIMLVGEEDEFRRVVKKQSYNENNA
jgi:predicted nucleotidyltransferase